ncbi:MAG: hypothetical protein FJX76_09965 [Armatimonadetes bacterium]|nr:hypothetical protein [Armatimonadota bacterium]
MKRLLSLLLSVLIVLQPLLAAAQSRVIRLPEAAVVRIKPSYEIRSDKVKTGDTVEFVVVEPVKVDGVTLISEGAIASGVVTKAKHASGFGQNGVLEISIRSVKFPSAR